MKEYELKNVLPPKRCPTCGQNIGQRHLKVLAANEEEATKMQLYLLSEGFEA